MTSRDFCFWLQGFFEIADLDEEVPTNRKLTSQQVDLIKRHLDMVFHHEITRSYGDEDHVDELKEVHDGETTGCPETALQEKTLTEGVKELMKGAQRARRPHPSWPWPGRPDIMLC